MVSERGGAYIARRVEKAPTSLTEETFDIVVNCLHDFSPVQALNPLSVLLITRTVARVEMHGVIEWGDGVG